MGRINDRDRQLLMAFRDEDLKRPKHDEIMLWANEWVRVKENLVQLRNPGLELLSTPRVDLERPLYKRDSEGRFRPNLVGFIDVAVDAMFKVGSDLRTPERLGYIQMSQDGYVLLSTYLVEIKTRVESIGDLLRQLNLYRDCDRRASVTVCMPSPEDDLIGVCRGQGIRLLDYPSGVVW